MGMMWSRLTSWFRILRGNGNIISNAHHASGSAVGSQLTVKDQCKQKWTQEQEELKHKLVVADVDGWARYRMMAGEAGNLDHQVEPLKYVGGVDISFVKGDEVNACAALVVLSFPDLQVVYEDMRMVELTAPYIPGFLAFREAPFLVEMVHKLHDQACHLLPQAILVDGNGILHPREFGLASHLGVLLDMTCVGVAKNLFHVDGLEKNEDHKEKIQSLTKGGDTFDLVGASGRTLGKALRSSDGAPKPVYVSVGHNISLDTAVWLTYKCCKYRIPEPTRQADIRSREYLRENFKPEDLSN